MSDSNDGGNSVMTSGPPQYVHSLSTEDVSPQSLERYRPSAISQQKYQKVTDLTGTGQQNPWPSSFSGVKTNTRDSWHSGGNSHLMDSSYLMRILGRDSQWVESSDKDGEREGYYSYLTGQGDTVLVRYSAGRDGFRVLHSQGVPGLDYWGNILTQY